MINIKKLLIAIFLVQGCSSEVVAKSKIEFEDGQTVENCSDYNRLRQSFFVKETIDNMILQSEYLDCSLKSVTEQLKNSAEVLELLLNNMLIRSVPTSLGQLTDDSDTLASVGFKVSVNTNSLEFVDGDRNLVISLKGKIDRSTYLIWITDEILNSTYRAYYPVKVKVDSTGAVTPMPFYESGY